MADIHVYKGNVTSGGVDGTLVSEGGLQTSPIEIGPLDQSIGEVSDSVKLAIRCSLENVTIGDVTITPLGTTSSKWALALDDNNSPGAFKGYGETLTISSAINSTNTIFWVKAKSDIFDEKENDTSVSFSVQAKLRKV